MLEHKIHRRNMCTPIVKILEILSALSGESLKQLSIFTCFAGF